MPTPQNKIYLGSILFEPNCWTQERNPSVRVSEWLDRIESDGYDGVDLWSPHAYKASQSELESLTNRNSSLQIFNGYAFLKPKDKDQQKGDSEFAQQLGCWAIKYNVGEDPSQRSTYLQQVKNWRQRIPDHITMLCECHIGSIVDAPETAKAFFEEAQLENHGLIIHPFAPFGRTGDWLETFGSKIMHAHVQVRDAEDDMAQIAEDLPRVKEAISIMKSQGYRGNFTMEFTKGSGFTGQSPETLYENGLKDLQKLRELLA